jgi:hypothetical protein
MAGQRCRVRDTKVIEGVGVGELAQGNEAVDSNLSIVNDRLGH